ncbi:MAG TPA: hypothetical protein VJV77_08390 [Casimicrobiaceae bacterium]|nr:hypothetical protein [Casimicrobiaceae bacterium]
MKTTHASAIVGLLSLFCASAAPATTATINYNDLWWDPNESGWGVSIAQQSSTLFLTFFIYGTDSKPTWVTGQLSKTGISAIGEPIFTGDVIATTGPYYGGPFNESGVTRRRAGTVTFSPADAVSATLTYTIDGVSVSKVVVRQTLANDDLSGNYFGVSYVGWVCPPDENAVTTHAIRGTISHSGTQFRYEELDGTNVCTWTGIWTQQGVLGRVDGTVSCADGMNGTFAMSQIASSPLAVSGLLSANVTIDGPQITSCTLAGKFSLLR